MKNIAILGSTGSIGTQALDVCRHLDYNVVGLAAYSNVKLLAEQTHIFRPKKICVVKQSCYKELKELLFNIDIDVEVVCGIDGLCEVASMVESDIVLNAVVGMVGLKPTLCAIKANKDIALANKETLVVGGHLVMSAAKNNGVKILPIDSEHSAIFQCIQGYNNSDIKKIILTASGGPFFGKTYKELETVSKLDALKHPNWSMGEKITIDSATLINKGLEIIEAYWLFDKSIDDIEVLVHRESVVHSMVEFYDNSVIAQLGKADMKIPIQYALTYPKRVESISDRISLFEYNTLSFDKPNEEVFVGLNVCRDAIKKGGVYPAIVNGANEEAVRLFLDQKINFLDIGELVQSALSLSCNLDENSLEDILIADKIARDYVLSKY